MINAMIFYLYLVGVLPFKVPSLKPIILGLANFLSAKVPSLKRIILFLANIKLIANCLASLGLMVLIYTLVTGHPVGEDQSSPHHHYFIVGSLWFWSLFVIIVVDGVIKRGWIRIRGLENFWFKHQNSANRNISRMSFLAPDLLNWTVKLCSQIGSPLISANLALDVPISQLNTYLLALTVLSLYSLGDVVRLDYSGIDILVGVIVGLLVTRKAVSGQGYINWITFAVASSSTACRMLRPVFVFLYQWAKSDASFGPFFDSTFSIEERKRENLALALRTSHVIDIDHPLVPLEERLASLGLKVWENTGDGNCLYRALAYQTYGSEDRHLEIRETMADYVMLNLDYFQKRYGLDANYCQTELLVANTWGGHCEASIFAMIYGITIYVFTDDMSAPLCIDPFHITGAVIPPDEKGVHSISLSYHNKNHYNSVRLCDDPGTGPALNFTLIVNGNQVDCIPEQKDIQNSIRATLETDL